MIGEISWILSCIKTIMNFVELLTEEDISKLNILSLVVLSYKNNLFAFQKVATLTKIKFLKSGTVTRRSCNSIVRCCSTAFLIGKFSCIFG